MSYIVTCPQCHEENYGSRLSCANCGSDLIGIPRQHQPMPQGPTTFSFKYESSRLVNLMAEYSKITTIRECLEWAGKAQLVADYISDAIAKTDNLILIEKERIEQKSNESEQANIQMSLMQYENFRNIIGSQLERLITTINSLPKGENADETVSLPPENVTLKKRKSKFSFINSNIIQIIVIVIVILILSYFLNSR